MKLAWFAPQLPSSMCSVPLPGVAVLEANTGEAIACALASVCTETL